MDNQILLNANLVSSRLTKEIQGLIKAMQEWSIKDIDALFLKCEKDILLLEEHWSTIRGLVKKEIPELSVLLENDEYINQLQSSMNAVGLQYQGEFPEYQLPPFKLFIDTKQLEARLSMGRKTQRINSLFPQALISLVKKSYDKVVQKKIDSKRFLQDLLPAYEIANRLTYGGNDVLWGRAVPLLKIYELLTIRRAAKQEYSKEQFLFDVGRMKEQFGLILDGYRFELGFARNQSKALVIVDSQGREHHLSSITVYRG